MNLVRFRVVLEIGNEPIERVVEAHNFDDDSPFNFLHFYRFEMPKILEDDNKPNRKSVVMFNPDYVVSIEEVND